MMVVALAAERGEKGCLNEATKRGREMYKRDNEMK